MDLGAFLVLKSTDIPTWSPYLSVRPGKRSPKREVVNSGIVSFERLKWRKPAL